ncbi:MAG TPA: quinate 5-dehydrogenase [Clostridia bacterium]|nr:quinate 5-dehydrogenase [Clostridia bacterium]
MRGKPDQGRVVSVSLGHPSRDLSYTLGIAGFEFLVERRGVGGDLEKACALVRELDGKVDAIGLGGVNLYYQFKDKFYPIREGFRLAKCATVTPVFDGSFVKRWVEPHVLERLEGTDAVKLAGKRVILVSVLDRYYLGKKCAELGARVFIGDALFGLGIPLLFGSWRAFEMASALLMPVLGRLPLRMIYPSPVLEEITPRSKEVSTTGAPLSRSCMRMFSGMNRSLLKSCDVFVGDLPMLLSAIFTLSQDLEGKTVITTTLSSSEEEHLLRRGLSKVITLGPRINGRSPGANVLEALLFALGRRIGFAKGENGSLKQDPRWQGENNGIHATVRLNAVDWLWLWERSGLGNYIPA